MSTCAEVKSPVMCAQGSRLLFLLYLFIYTLFNNVFSVTYTSGSKSFFLAERHVLKYPKMHFPIQLCAHNAKKKKDKIKILTNIFYYEL
jgi:hypothetical protein